VGRPSPVKKAFFLALLLGGCWLVIELGLWVLAPVPAPHALAPGHPDVRGHNRFITFENPHGVCFTGVADPARTPGIEGPITVTFNDFGFRSPRLRSVEKPAGVVRVFCVGGSTTIGLVLDDRDAWPEQLQVLLERQYPHVEFDVVNAGVNAGTTRHDLNLISQRVLAFEPDVLVLMQGINDWCLPKEPDYSPIRMGRASYRSREYDYLRRKLKWLGVKEILSTSQLFRRIVYAKRGLGLGRIDREEWDVSGRVLDRLRADHARRRLEAMPARLMAPKPEFTLNLRTISGMCRAHGVRLVLVTQPVMWQPNMPDRLRRLCWMGFSGDVAYEPGDLAQMMENYNRAVLTLGRQESVPVVDAARHLPRDDTVFYDDCHFNVSGAAKLAGRIMETLIAGDVLREPTAEALAARSKDG
jgi:lysophospholipase L1-like esterase